MLPFILQSYREDKAFLITQSPLPDTIVDFWRMVYEYKVCTIVNLDRIVNQVWRHFRSHSLIHLNEPGGTPDIVE